MIPAIRSEFRKFFTTRMWWGMAIAIFVAGGAFAALFTFVVNQGTTGGPGGRPIIGDDTQIANSVYTSGISVGYLLLLTIGVMSIGSEYRHKTISATFLATPKRTRAMLAKVVALIGIGAVYGLISLVGSVAVGAVGLHPDRPARLPVLGGRPLPGAQPARARAVGADRPRHRHPHPEPGGGPAHRHRRGLDRRAAARAARWASGSSGASTSSSSCRRQATNAVVNGISQNAGRGAPRVVGRRPGARGLRRGAGRVRHLAHDARRHQLTRGPRGGRWTDVGDDGRSAETRRTGRRRAHHSPCDGVPPEQRG